MSGYKFIFDGDELELRLTVDVATRYEVETGTPFTDYTIYALGFNGLTRLLRLCIHDARKAANKSQTEPAHVAVCEAVQDHIAKRCETDDIQGDKAFWRVVNEFIKTSILMYNPKAGEEEKENPTE